MSDPPITVICWRGPMSALAARQKMTADELRRKLRAHGLKRGAAWEIQVSSPVAMATLQRKFKIILLIMNFFS